MEMTALYLTSSHTLKRLARAGRDRAELVAELEDAVPAYCQLAGLIIVNDQRPATQPLLQAIA